MTNSTTSAQQLLDVGSTGTAPSYRRFRLGFLAVVVTYLATQAFSTVPSPLYSTYAVRDQLSALTITMVYAVYALGVAVSLVFAGHLSDEWGRRPVLIAAIAVNVASCVVFILAPTVFGLFLARLLCGLAVGVATSTATVYLHELFLAHRPPERIGRLRILTSAIAIGGLGVGALVAGVVAAHTDHPLVLPYATMLIFFAISLLGLAAAPETRPRAGSRPPYRIQRVAVPSRDRGSFFASLAGVAIVFAVFGLFVGLAGTVLGQVLHEHSMQLSGVVLFVVFGAGAVATTVVVRWEHRRMVQVAGGALAVGLALLVLSLWLSTPSLAVFVLAGAVIGVGGATLFTASLAVATAVAPRDRVAGTLAGFFLAGYVGISVPVVGTGLALQHLSVRVTLLGFAVVLIGALAVGLPKLAGTKVN